MAIRKRENERLKKKYRSTRLKEVKHIGVDEICVGRNHGKPGFLTIVRNLDTGAALFVGDGKMGNCYRISSKKYTVQKQK